MTKSWTWNTATPKERGEHVRGTAPHCFHNLETLRGLFNLTPHGLRQIMAGDHWRPEYQADSECDPLADAMDRMTENRCR
jgi:hypothetical protein